MTARDKIFLKICMPVDIKINLKASSFPFSILYAVTVAVTKHYTPLDQLRLLVVKVACRLHHTFHYFFSHSILWPIVQRIHKSCMKIVLTLLFFRYYENDEEYLVKLSLFSSNPFQNCVFKRYKSKQYCLL